MKAFDLIHSLSKPEKQRFEAVIKNKGRNSLHHLWKYLQKTQKGNLDKEQLFKAAYKEKYDKKKDYLLRNELRLLSDELSAFIIEREFEIELKENANFKNLQYLRALRKRGLTDIFITEYDKLYNKASNEMQMRFKEEMRQEHMTMLYNIFDKKNVAKEVVDACDQYMEGLTEHAYHQTRIAEFYKAIALRRWQLDPINKNESAPAQPKPLLQLDMSEFENRSPITKYYYYITRALDAQGKEQLKFLISALVSIEQCEFPGIKQWRLKAGCLSFMGIIYSELGMIDEQFKLFKASIILHEENGNKAYTQLFNYLMGLLFHKRTTTFWKELESYNNWFQTENELRGLDNLIQHAYEIEGNYNKALEYLSKAKFGTDAGYLTIKSNLVHIYYQKDMVDLAGHEAENALHYLRDRDKKNFRYQSHTVEFKLAKTLADFKLALPEEQSALIKKIKEIQDGAGEGFLNKMVTTFPPMKWVIEEAEGVLANQEG